MVLHVRNLRRSAGILGCICSICRILFCLEAPHARRVLVHDGTERLHLLRLVLSDVEVTIVGRSPRLADASQDTTLLLGEAHAEA